MRIWVLGEFGEAEGAREAVRALRGHGFMHLDAYSPFPIDGMDEALGLGRSWVRVPTLLVGLGTAGFAYWLQWYTNAVDYPLNVGDHPLLSFPSFIPDAYETLILFASFSAFFALLIAAGLPRLHHPVFKVPGFESSSVGSFWVSATVDSPRDREEASRHLTKLGASKIEVVEEEESE